MKRLFVNIFMAARLYVLLLSPGIFYLGAAMNQAVLYANGGKFPVMMNDLEAYEMTELPRDFGIHGISPNGMIDTIHCRMTDKTHLNWLADWINLQVMIMSPGDVLIETGDWSFQFLLGAWAALIVSDLAKFAKFNGGRPAKARK